MTKSAAKKPAPRKTADPTTPARKAAAKEAPPAKKAPAAAPKPAKKVASSKTAPKAVTKKTSAKPTAAAPDTPAGNRFTERFGPAVHAPQALPVPMEVISKPAAKIDPKIANAWKSKAGRELTEVELLAMPESEYMGDKQIDFFRARLQAQRDDLLSNAGETTEHLREDTSIVPDPADRATIEEEHALELRTRDRERKLLKKIAQSLSRLDSGEYGYCDETGEPIGLARLLARSTATLSLEAQQRRELKQKMFGD